MEPTAQKKTIFKLRSIQTKLTLSIILILIPVITLLSVTSYRNTQTLVNKEVFNQIESQATQKQDDIDNLFLEYLKQARLIASLEEIRILTEDIGENSIEEEKAAQTLGKILKFHSDFENLSLINKEGTTSASTDLELVGKKENNLPFQISETQTDTIQATNNLLFITTPINQSSNEPHLLAIKVNNKKLQNIVTNYIGLGQTGEIVIGKREGDKIIYLNKLRNKASTENNFLSIINNPRAPIVLAAQKLSGSVETTDYRGATVIAAYQYLPSTNWGLVVKIDVAEVFQPLDNLKKELLLISLLILLLFILVAFIVSRSIVKPLQKLHLGTEKIAKGEWDYQLHIHTGDEVEQLANEFSNMAQQLKGLYQGLEEKVQIRTEELNQAKQKIEREKLKDEAILTSIGDGVAVTDEKGNIVFFNKAAEQFSLFQSSEVIGQEYSKVLGIMKSEKQKANRSHTPIHKALRFKKVSHSDKLMFTNKDGNIYPVYLVATPLIIEGTIIGAIVAFRDITKEKAVDRMKTEFISVASHQLRTPLSSIKWFAEMLIAGDAGKLQEEQKEFLNQIYNSNERMIELVNSLLNVSRIEEGRITIEPEPTDLKQLVDQVTTELTPKIKQKNLNIVMSIHENLPKISVDPKLIRQVYANLLSNAVKYTPNNGEVQIIISRKGNKIISQVQDTGLGIPQSEQGRVFSKFFRSDNIRKISSEGTGLGLYIVKSIIESSGGKIWFESEENKGTSFWFTLPIKGTKPQKGERSLEETKL